MNLGSLTKSKVISRNHKGGMTKGMTPDANKSGKPGFKSGTKAAKGPCY